MFERTLVKLSVKIQTVFKLIRVTYLEFNFNKIYLPTRKEITYIQFISHIVIFLKENCLHNKIYFRVLAQVVQPWSCMENAVQNAIKISVIKVKTFVKTIIKSVIAWKEDSSQQ